MQEKRTALHHIGVLTSGGDAPGMNAAIRAVVKASLYHGMRVTGIEDGYQGLIEGRSQALGYDSVNNVIHQGGTFLGTARSEEFRTQEGRQRAWRQIQDWRLDGLVVIGGDGSYAGAEILGEETGLPIIGLPGTIDNDIYGTDHTIGYDTAINTAVEAIDKIRDTATSHHRIFMVEVMGREAGFIALNSGLATGADEVLVPEEWTDLPSLVAHIKECAKGKRSAIIVVAEGDDAGNVAEIKRKIAPQLGDVEIRTTVLGHIQRGGRPSAFDRILATKLGCAAVEELLQGSYSVALGLQEGEVKSTPFHEAVKLHAAPKDIDLLLLHKMRTR